MDGGVEGTRRGIASTTVDRSCQARRHLRAGNEGGFALPAPAQQMAIEPHKVHFLPQTRESQEDASQSQTNPPLLTRGITTAVARAQGSHRAHTHLSAPHNLHRVDGRAEEDGLVQAHKGHRRRRVTVPLPEAESPAPEGDGSIGGRRGNQPLVCNCT